MKQIQKFWTWFQANEQEISNAFLLGIDAEEVFFKLNKNFIAVSKRIGFIIRRKEKGGKCIIVFTCEGYTKLFPKVKALENQAPSLDLFIPQAFIKPTDNLQKIKEKKDSLHTFENYELKISDLHFTIENFNTTLKQLNIEIVLTNFSALRPFEELHTDIKYMIMEVIGEINYRKNIRRFEIAQLVQDHKGVLNISHLQECIDYMYIRKPRKK